MLPFLLKVLDQKVSNDWTLKSGGHFKSPVVTYGNRYAAFILSPGANNPVSFFFLKKILSVNE
jgi:hypothetical protein